MQVHSLYKAPKGLIRIEAELDSGILGNVRITGDFFMVPEDSLPNLESCLEGIRLDADSVGRAVDDFYSSGVETPMLGKEDMVKAILGVSNGS